MTKVQLESNILLRNMTSTDVALVVALRRPATHVVLRTIVSDRWLLVSIGCGLFLPSGNPHISLPTTLYIIKC